MKFSLISATSVFALLSAGVGPAHAAVFSVAPSRANIFDLVHDGNTSSDGGDKTVPRQDPLVSAVVALEMASIGRQQAGFTGPVDTFAASGTALTRVPLGAAPGTRPDVDFATPITGAWHWNAWQKSLAIGVTQIAPLIGTVGNSAAPGDKPGSTVFVAEGSRANFTDGGNTGMRSPSVTAFAPNSTSTATITVAGAGNFRSREGSSFAVVAANSLQAQPAASEPAPKAVALGEAAQQTLGYQYAPSPGPAVNGNAVAASFSNSVSADGIVADIAPVTPAKTQTSLRQTLPGTKDVATTYAKLIDLSLPVGGNANNTGVDGTRLFVSASVSANPTTTAALYVASVVSAAPVGVSGQTVEAFQIGPAPAVLAKGGAGTTVADPLRGKVMASTGALNNSLALP